MWSSNHQLFGLPQICKQLIFTILQAKQYMNQSWHQLILVTDPHWSQIDSGDI